MSTPLLSASSSASKDSTPAGGHYSRFTGFVFSYNLIVGTGALALPLAFKDAGWVLAPIVLAVIVFLAYITVTYMIEAQGAGNAFMIYEREYGTSAVAMTGRTRQDATEATRLLADADGTASPPPGGVVTAGGGGDGGGDVVKYGTGLSGDVESERDPVHRGIFAIKQRAEMGAMAEMFFPPWGEKLFYLTLMIYLFGDLAIYGVVVPRSMTALFNGFPPLGINEHDGYYLYLTIFAVVTCPLVFFNLQKTKYLQLLTLGMRLLAFCLMVILAFVFIGEGQGADPKKLTVFNVNYMPSLYGVAVYSFMCHHSLPSIVTPMENKKRLYMLYLWVGMAVFVSYNLLSYSAMFAFAEVSYPSCSPDEPHPCSIQAPYTENFISYNVRPIAYFIALYPCFVCWTNYPIIAVTLRNNMYQFFGKGQAVNQQPLWKRLLFPFIASVPPIGIAYLTRNMELLVDITGSYPGLCIEFIVPSLLVWQSRRWTQQKFGEKVHNPNASPFRSRFWLWLMSVWVLLALGLNTYNLVRQIRGN